MESTFIPSNVNISEIVSSIQSNNSAATQLIKVIAKGLDTFSKIDMDAFNKNSSNFNKLSKGIIDYTNLINEIITVLIRPSELNLSDVLGYVDEQRNHKGEVIVKSQYKTVDAISQFSIVIDTLLVQLEKLSAKKFNLSHLSYIKVNVIMMKKIVKDILDILLSISNSTDLSKLHSVLDVFGSGPTTVKNISESIDNSIYDQNGKLTKADTLSTNESITESGRMGVIDIVLKMFEIANMLSVFSPTYMVKTFLRLKIMKITFKSLFETIYELMNSINSNIYSDMGKFAEAISDQDKGLVGVFMGINQLKLILDKIGNITTLLKMRVRTYLMMKWIEDVIVGFVRLKESKTIYSVASEQTLNLFTSLNKVFSKFSEAYKVLSSIKFIPILSNTVESACKQLLDISIKLDEIFKKFNKVEFSNIENIDNIKDIINDIYEIQKIVIKIAITSAIFVLAAPVTLMGITMLGIFLTIVINMFKLLDKIINPSRIVNIKRSLFFIRSILADVAIVMLGIIGLSLVSYLVLKFYDIVSLGFATFFIILVTIITAIYLISKLMKSAKISLNLLYITGIILLISITLTSFAISMLSLALIGGIVIDNIGNVFAMIGIMAGVVLAFIGLGALLAIWAPLALFVLVGVGLFALVSASLILISLSLLVIALIPIDIIKGDGETTGAAAKAKSIINIAKDVMFALINATWETPKESNEGWIMSLLRYVALGGVANIIEGIVAFAFIAITTASVFLLVFLAGLLWLLTKIELNPNKINKAVTNIINCAKHVFESLLSTTTTLSKDTDEGILGKLLRFVGLGQITTIIEAILSFAFVTLTTFTVGMVLLLGLMLNKIVEFNFSPTTIKEKVEDIIESANNIYRCLTSAQDLKYNSEGILEKAARVLLPDSLVDIVQLLTAMPWAMSAMLSIGVMGKIAENLKSITNLDITGVDTKASSIVTSVNSIFKSLVGQSLNIDDAEDKLDIWGRAIQYLNDYSNIDDNGVKKVSDNFIKFIDKVNGADLDKLKETTEMFRQMAAFSESISGDFDKLADALNEKIAPLLEKISGSVEKMPDAINNASDKTNMFNYELASNTSKAQVSNETISKISNKTEAQKMQEKRDKAIAAGGYSGTIEDIIAILTDEGVKIGRR